MNNKYIIRLEQQSAFGIGRTQGSEYLSKIPSNSSINNNKSNEVKQRDEKTNRKYNVNNKKSY